MASKQPNLSPANAKPETKVSFRPPALGGVSLLVIFAVLCLTVFALLSLSTVQADIRLADASAQAVSEYYAADSAAEEILARLRAGQLPEGVSQTADGAFAYTLPINENQQLEVEVRLGGDASWQVLRWQAVPVSSGDYDNTLELWDGSGF